MLIVDRYTGDVCIYIYIYIYSIYILYTLYILYIYILLIYIVLYIEVYTHANIHLIVCLAVSTFTNHEFPGFTAGSLSATAERRAHGVRF